MGVDDCPRSGRHELLEVGVANERPDSRGEEALERIEAHHGLVPVEQRRGRGRRAARCRDGERDNADRPDEGRVPGETGPQVPATTVVNMTPPLVYRTPGRTKNASIE